MTDDRNTSGLRVVGTGLRFLTSRKAEHEAFARAQRMLQPSPADVPGEPLTQEPSTPTSSDTRPHSEAVGVPKVGVIGAQDPAFIVLREHTAGISMDTRPPMTDLTACVLAIWVPDGPTARTMEAIAEIGRVELPILGVALVGADLVDDEELIELVEMEAREVLAESGYDTEAIPMFRLETSATELIAHISNEVPDAVLVDPLPVPQQGAHRSAEPAAGAQSTTAATNPERTPQQGPPVEHADKVRDTPRLRRYRRTGPVASIDRSGDHMVIRTKKGRRNVEVHLPVVEERWKIVDTTTEAVEVQEAGAPIVFEVAEAQEARDDDQLR